MTSEVIMVLALLGILATILWRIETALGKMKGYSWDQILLMREILEEQRLQSKRLGALPLMQEILEEERRQSGRLAMIIEAIKR